VVNPAGGVLEAEVKVEMMVETAGLGKVVKVGVDIMVMAVRSEVELAVVQMEVMVETAGLGKVVVEIWAMAVDEAMEAAAKAVVKAVQGGWLVAIREGMDTVA